MNTPVDPVFLAGLLPGVLLALAQRGPDFRTVAFLASWTAANALCAWLVGLGNR